MERREFLQKGCKVCMGVAGAAIFPSLLTSCSPIPIYKTEYTNKQVIVPLVQFAESNFVIARCSNVNYDIAVIKGSDQQFRSYLMRCTHADNPVDFNGKEFSCSLHGSIFSDTGQVRRGPADKPLPSFQTTADTDRVVISF